MALGSGVVWSFGAILARLAKQADAFQYLIWRSLGILVVMEVVARYRHRPPTVVTAFRSGKWMLTSIFGLFLASLTFVYAVKTTSAANAAFLSSVTPLAAVLLARFVLGERLTRITAIALAVATCGLAITVLGDLSAGNMIGNLSALISSVGFAIYTVGVRSDPKADWSPVLPGYAALMIAVCGAITLASGKSLYPGATAALYGFAHGAVFIVVGTLLFNYGSRHVPAVPMTVFAQTEMVFVPIWAFLMLGEAPKVATIIGGAIIFTAVVGKALVDARDANA